jgi:hypothetical protein
MSQNIELTRLWARTDAKTGRQVLSGKMGFNARLRIEELAEPDERGATHVVSILPPYIPRNDDGGPNDGFRQQAAATSYQRQQSAPGTPARQQSPEQSPATQPAPAFGFASDEE